MRKTTAQARPILCLALSALILTSCSRLYIIKSTDLMRGVTGSGIQADTSLLTADSGTEAIRFALEFLKRTASDDKNTLISPWSLYQSLSMAANGAAGQTAQEFDRVLGMSTAQRNEFLLALSSGMDRKQVANAAAVWLRDTDGFEPKKEFLQANAAYYGASVYKSSFDNTTLSDINHWAQRNTDGMIDRLLDEVGEDAVMVLLNAVAADLKWEKPYTTSEVMNEHIFTNADGEEVRVDMMFSSEKAFHLQDDGVSGFMKPYEGDRFAFAAVLPPEGTTPAQYLESLTAEKYIGMLTGETYEVDCLLPKFTSGDTVPANDVLAEMGLASAFGGNADFSGLSDSPLRISEIIHKTYIEVNENGTRAAAVTETAFGGGANEGVILDRPFLYLIFDTLTNVPLFIGCLNYI